MSNLKPYTDAEIGEQAQRVLNAPPNAKYYEQGRHDFMREVYVPPKDVTTTGRLQWEAGWRDEMLDIERPF